MKVKSQKKYQFRTLLNISADFDKDEMVGVEYDGQSAIFVLFEFSNGKVDEINRIVNNHVVPFAGDNFYDDIQISLSQGCLNSFDDLFILYYNYAKFSNDVDQNYVHGLGCMNMYNNAQDQYIYPTVAPVLRLASSQYMLTIKDSNGNDQYLDLVAYADACGNLTLTTGAICFSSP